MSNKNSNADIYFKAGCGRCPLGNTPQCKVNKWQAELETLRAIAHDSQLDEELKWGMPCYTFQNSNVLMISAFNECCALSFFKGALLNDPKNILEKPGENTQSARLIRFTHVQEIADIEETISTYIQEAVELEKTGAKVQFKDISEWAIPEELQHQFDELPALKTAFNALTAGRQRAYLLHFSAPKQTKTRVSRIEKCTQQILNGKGLNEY